MSKLCFSYQAEAPLSMPFACFSYPGDAAREAGDRAAGTQDRSGLRWMPQTCYRYPLMCFGYPPAGGSSDAATPARPGPVRMPVNLCFRY
jgi:hypothetical protein